MKILSKPVTLRGTAKVADKAVAGSLREFFKQATPRLRKKGEKDE